MDRRLPRRLGWLAFAALVAVLAAVLLAVPGSAQEDTVYVNVASGENEGCSNDDADFIVNIWHDGDKVASIPEITHHSSPLWGAVEQLDGIGRGEDIAFQVREGESGLFSHWRETCDLSSGSGKKGNLTWSGERRAATFEGDGGDAARLRVVVGPNPPPTPDVHVADNGTDWIQLSWPQSGGTEGYVLRHPWSNSYEAEPGGEASGYNWSGLKDNRDYRFQVIRDQPPWMAGTIVSASTENAVPPAPEVTNLEADGDTVSVTWRDATLHDGDRMEIHAGPEASFEPTNDTRRATAGFHDGPFAHDNREQTTEASLEPDDAYLKLRTVDTAGAQNTSEALRAFGAPSVEVAYTSDDGLAVNWTHRGITPDRFEIHTGPEGFTVSASTERARASDPSDGPAYERDGIDVPADHEEVVVRAAYGDGRAQASPPAAIVDDPPPPAPQVHAAVIQDESIRIDWQAHLPEDVAKAVVLAGAEPADPRSYDVVEETTELDPDRPDRSMLVDRSPEVRYVAVQLVDERGQTGTSEAVEVEDRTPPPTPVIDQAVGEDELRIRWHHDPPDDLARYEVHAVSSSSEGTYGDHRLAVVNDWQSSPMEVAGIDLPDDVDHVRLDAVDEAGNVATSEPTEVQDGSALIPTPTVKWAVEAEGYEIAWTVPSVDRIESFRIHATSGSPPDLELEPRGPSIEASEATDYVRDGWPLEPGDEQVLVEARGADGATSRSAPVPVAEGVEAVSAQDTAWLESGNVDDGSHGDGGEEELAEQSQADPSSEDTSGSIPWTFLAIAILLTGGLTAAFLRALGDDGAQ